jgi:hypothetical protein
MQVQIFFIKKIGWKRAEVRGNGRRGQARVGMEARKKKRGRADEA